jgi:hypothetical protein
MIVEQTLLHSPRQTVVTGVWHPAIDRPHVIGIRAVACRIRRSLTEWARVPALPYVLVIASESSVIPAARRAKGLRSLAAASSNHCLNAVTSRSCSAVRKRWTSW